MSDKAAVFLRCNNKPKKFYSKWKSHSETVIYLNNNLKALKTRQVDD